MQQRRPLTCQPVNMQSAAIAADDFTLEALGTRFPSMSELMEIPDGEERLHVMEMHLKTRLADLPLARVRVAPSAIEGAGMGLFATRDITSAGELVTLYPCDTLVTLVPSSSQEDDGESIPSSHVSHPGAPPQPQSTADQVDKP